ncbi:N-formylglutamate deformylase [Cupriavidus sp. USMAA2-4]|uniref:N-formylglutamate deformylase n=1 Tax=Cupriavidus malaysiensis TaxID=367825 RepID=A0A1D9I5N4_9BURK|nr:MULTISPECIES: N-formylglutamate deformylase [Cupriavidus]AOY94213.1 N-formylglutamate deformylase [Cupriavidus sp. USMAA2-4]AOZ00658.1 N-formylglutamate deformylase [Cupriavidus sp. USMAHM13]AOZ07416.1 N-formylglutamate deformylase [Cupriavidus malaysiensis]
MSTQPLFSTDKPAFTLHRGTRPLLVSMPHVGTYVPAALAERFTDEARTVPDTDWHLERLYDFAREMGASILAATHSRYVIDLNRPPDNANLYPGQDTTGLCPVDTFDKTPVYAGTGAGPDDAEIAARRDAVWHPYHAALAGELARLRAEHGTVALWEAHSIRSVLPRFFEGRLPDFNLGSANGASCDKGLADRLLAIAQAVPGHTAVLNGRYKGGHITRFYGQPQQGVHAVQLELAQCAYMSEQYPFAYDAPRATALQPVLRDMLGTMLAFVEGK